MDSLPSILGSTSDSFVSASPADDSNASVIIPSSSNHSSPQTPASPDVSLPSSSSSSIQYHLQLDSDYEKVKCGVEHGITIMQYRPHPHAMGKQGFYKFQSESGEPVTAKMAIDTAVGLFFESQRLCQSQARSSTSLLAQRQSDFEREIKTLKRKEYALLSQYKDQCGQSNRKIDRLMEEKRILEGRLEALTEVYARLLETVK